MMKPWENGPVVSVIIPARDAARTLERTLRALSQQEFENAFEVIVVDDGSSDDTAVLARSYEPLVKVIRNELPGGAGAARNLGVGHARASLLAFTDADCFPARDWLSRGLDRLTQADIVQGRVEPDPGQAPTPFDRTLSVQRDRGFYQTANLFVRREVFEKTGGFRDRSLGLRKQRGTCDTPPRRPIGEDTVFGWMACRSGARSTFASDALVHHAVVPGRIRDAVADRWNWSTKMAGLAKLVPELRTTVFYRRWFFTNWTASFDMAVVGLVASLVSRKKWPLAVAAPYATQVYRNAAQYLTVSEGHVSALTQTGRYVLGVPIVDAVTLAGLVAGSVAWRTVVL